MKTVSSPEPRSQLTSRLERLVPNTVGRWGSLTAAEMLCHLGDSFESVLGVRVPPGPPPSGKARPFLKWLILYSPMPWPKGVKTRPGVDPHRDGTQPGDFERDRHRVITSLNQLAAAPASSLARVHFMVGPMSQKDWLRWAYKHVDHHLRQFGPLTHTTSEVTGRLIGLGALLGIAGVVLFGIVHALAIVPIWRRLVGGLPFAIAAALAVTWAFHTLVRSGRWAVTLGGGLRFGVLCWVAGVPATILVNAIRLAAAPGPRPSWVDPASFLVAALTGTAVFGALGRDRRTALTGGLAIAVLLALGGGVVPVVNSHRAAGLWAGLLVVEACGGVLLTLGYRRLLVRRSSRAVR